MAPETGGFRGYISSRPVRDTSYPQRIQNAVVRGYAARHDLTFKLSLTEYAMPGCFMIFETLLKECVSLDGVIVFSMFMLPRQRAKRASIYERLLSGGTQLHAALEETAIRNRDDVGRFEDTLDVALALDSAPLRGRFRKDGDPFPQSDAFVSVLTRALRPS